MFHHVHHQVNRINREDDASIPFLPEEKNPVFYIYPICIFTSIIFAALWLFTDILMKRPQIVSNFTCYPQWKSRNLLIVTNVKGFHRLLYSSCIIAISWNNWNETRGYISWFDENQRWGIIKSSYFYSQFYHVPVLHLLYDHISHTRLDLSGLLAAGTLEMASNYLLNNKNNPLTNLKMNYSHSLIN